MTLRVAHLLGPAHGGMLRHVRYLAAHPPDGFTTAGVFGPPSLVTSFRGVRFEARPVSRLAFAGRCADVVHAHGITAGLAALVPAGPPVVVTLHLVLGGAGRTSRSVLLHALGRLVVARADAVVAVSAAAARGVPGAVVVAPASDPPAPPARSREEVRAELGASAGEVVVATVARLHPDKRLDVFVDAVARAGCTGWIAGDGPERARLAARVAGTKVRLLGWRDDVSDVLAAADVFALASPAEGYGLAVEEAVHAGLPVVAVDTGAIASIAGDAGVLVAPGDDAAFAAAVERLVRDPSERARLTAVTRRAGPGPGALVEALGDVYRKVLA